MHDVRRQVAFTLIELLVTIAILAILVAILVPALRKLRESSQHLVCTNNLTAIGWDTRGYSDQNAGRFPRWVYAFEAGKSGRIVVQFKPKKAVVAGLNTYEPDVLVCPSDSSPSVLSVKGAGGTTGQREVSYGFNIDLHHSP